MRGGLAVWLFRAIAGNEEASDLVDEVAGLRRGAMVATVLSLLLPMAGLGLWQKFGVKSSGIVMVGGL